MKKTIIAVSLLLFVSVSAMAQKVNVMTNAGGIVSGEVIGSDDNSIFVKAADGNAKTISLNKINKIFDAYTRKDITADFKNPVAAAAPAKEDVKEGLSKKNEQETVSSRDLQYEVIQGESGSISTRSETGIFVRTVPKYLGFGIVPMQVNLLFSNDNVRLKKTMKNLANDAGGYTYDDSTLMVSAGFSGFVYIRPIDCLAIGGFYGLSPMNQNLQVYRGAPEKFLYIDLPITEYGALIKFIPYSTAVIGNDGVPVETMAVGFDFKLGVAKLGTVFGDASINDETDTSTPLAILTSQAPYFAVEFAISSQENFMQFGIGYQQCMMTEIDSSKYFKYITNDAGTVVSDIDGNIPFSAQALYAYLAIAF
jgi:hypothetical protein